MDRKQIQLDLQFLSRYWELTPGPISLFDGVWLNVSPEEDNDSLWSKGYVSAMTHLINLKLKVLKISWRIGWHPVA